MMYLQTFILASATESSSSRIIYTNWWKKSCLANLVILEGYPAGWDPNPKTLKGTQLEWLAKKLEDGTVYYRKMNSDEISLGERLPPPIGVQVEISPAPSDVPYVPALPIVPSMSNTVPPVSLMPSGFSGSN